MSSRELEMAARLVESMEAKWNPADYKDEYEEALHRMIKDKAAGSIGTGQSVAEANASRIILLTWLTFFRGSLKSAPNQKEQSVAVPKKNRKRHARLGLRLIRLRRAKLRKFGLVGLMITENFAVRVC